MRTPTALFCSALHLQSSVPHEERWLKNRVRFRFGMLMYYSIPHNLKSGSMYRSKFKIHAGVQVGVQVRSLKETIIITTMTANVTLISKKIVNGRVHSFSPSFLMTAVWLVGLGCTPFGINSSGGVHDASTRVHTLVDKKLRRVHSTLNLFNLSILFSNSFFLTPLRFERSKYNCHNLLILN